MTPTPEVDCRQITDLLADYVDGTLLLESMKLLD